jgi:hypothetical protein
LHADLVVYRLVSQTVPLSECHNYTNLTIHIVHLATPYFNTGKKKIDLIEFKQAGVQSQSVTTQRIGMHQPLLQHIQRDHL